MTSAHLETSATVPTWRPASSALLGVGGVGAEAYADVDAGVLEVEGVGVALGAVADDGDFFGLDEGEVCVLRRGRSLPLGMSFGLSVLSCQLLVYAKLGDRMRA